MAIRISQFCNNNNILPPIQHGFHSKHSIHIQLLQVYILLNTFLDINHTFDSVWYDLKFFIPTFKTDPL